MRIHLIFLFLATSAITISQSRDYDRVMSFKQFVDEISHSEKNRIDFNSVRFEFREEAEDSIYVKYEPPREGIQPIKHVLQGIKATSSIVFYDCQFDDRFLEFNECEFRNFEFVNCDLPVRLTFDQCRFEGNLSFIDCKYEDQSLTLKNCLLRRGIIIGIGSVFGGVLMVENTFDKNPLPYSVLFQEFNDFWAPGSAFVFPVHIFDSRFESLEISETDLTVADGDTAFSLVISDSEIDKYQFSRVKVSSMAYSNTSFNNQVRFDSVHIANSFLLSNVDFPAVNTSLSWDLLKGNILGTQSDGEIYKGETDKQLDNTLLFNDLISIYKNLYQIYKSRGDQESANGCYVEMKDLETARLKHIQEKNPATYTWLNWKLNQFLDFFCDYGTNPIKALFIALWTILGFAVLYFFFYDDWDRINRSFLVRQHRKLIEYFRSEKKLAEFHSEKYEDQINSYLEYRSELENSKIEIPFFIRMLGMPLFQLLRIRYFVLKRLYNRVEVLGGRWNDLKPMRKVLVGSVVGPAIMFYLLYLAFIRSLNSLVLSINTFSTLGFGDIPVKRFLRYIAIIEGFLGWFLLSIFSVSLISQILQSL